MIAWLRKSANIDESIPSKHCSLKQTLGCSQITLSDAECGRMLF